MFLFTEQDYYANWNVITIHGLSFAFLILFQWLSFATQLRFHPDMRVLLEVILNSGNIIFTSMVLIIIALFAVQDFLYFKSYSAIGNTGGFEQRYSLMLTKNFKAFLFGDFDDDEINGYDWIDFSVFVGFTVLTMILLTNVLIAYMGDAYEYVQTTSAIRKGLGRAEVLLELEILMSTLRPCLEKIDRIERMRDRFVYFAN